jgi:hypothetical protein
VITGAPARKLTRTFQERVALIGDRAARTAAAEWMRLTSYDEAAVQVYAAATRSAMTAAKAAAVRTGTAYYATLGQFRPPAVKVTDVKITPNPREPFIAYWNALEGGHPWEEAIESGSARAEAAARNLSTSAARQAGDVTMSRARQEPSGWQRIPDGDACPWCLDLASFTFPSAEAADFGHDRCNCSVVPVL